MINLNAPPLWSNYTAYVKALFMPKTYTKLFFKTSNRVPFTEMRIEVVLICLHNVFLCVYQDVCKKRNNHQTEKRNSKMF